MVNTGTRATLNTRHRTQTNKKQTNNTTHKTETISNIHVLHKNGIKSCNRVE